MTSPTLLVLAAGMGSRYGGLKQIAPVGPGGESLLDYSVYDALRAGFGKLAFVIRKDIESQFRQMVGRRFEHRIEVEYVFQELDNLPPGFNLPLGRTKPWGTAHATLVARSAIHEPFAVINADDFYGDEGYRTLAAHLHSGSEEYAMVGFVLRRTLSDFGSVSRGVCQVDEGDFLEDVVELTHLECDGMAVKNTDKTGRITDLTGDEVVSMNMWGFTPHVFDQLRAYFRQFLEMHGTESRSECYLPGAINEFVRRGAARVKVLRTNGAWFGVTHREDHPQVVTNIRRLIQEGKYPERLWL